MQQLIYFPDGQEGFIEQVKEKCSQKKTSLSQVILHQLKSYMEEDIYIPTEEEPRDALAMKVLSLFEEFCPSWKKPTLSEKLVIQINVSLNKVKRGPDYWKILFQKAYEIWNGAIWEPDFFWFLDLDHHFKVTKAEQKVKEERRKKEEQAKKAAELARIKQEKHEQKLKDKAEKDRLKQEAAEFKAKKKKPEEEIESSYEIRDEDEDYERFGGNE